MLKDDPAHYSLIRLAHVISVGLVCLETLDVKPVLGLGVSVLIMSCAGFHVKMQIDSVLYSTNNVHHRLSIIALAQALGNVSEACRRQGISRTQFYEYKQRFQKLGLEGLKDLHILISARPIKFSNM
jgi:hypothetical protein